MRKRAHETAREGVAGAGRIENFFERKCWGPKNGFAVKHEDTVLATLHDERLWPHCHYFICSTYEIRLVRQHPGFSVIDDQNIDVLDRLLYGFEFAFDPKIHRIA